MFGVKHNECVGFDSRWTVKKVYYEGATQTPLYVSKNATTETTCNKEVEIQTDAPEILKTPLVNMDRLAGFLTQIYPRVMKELDESSNSTAFVGYKLHDSEETKTKLLQMVEVIPQDEVAEIMNSAKISSISWSCSARTVAVSLCYPHQSWCYDPGLVLIYTLDREDRISSTPSRKISCDSCVSHLKFHPLMPALLVGSTHAGNIVLWNIQDDANESVLMKINRIDNVSYLNWMTLDHVTLDVVFLVTASLDGTITMWRFNNSYTCANVYEKYKIKPPVMSQLKLSKVKKQPNAPDSGVGVTCFDFSKHQPDMFLVGTEGGLVIQCSTSKPTKLKADTDIEPLYDPAYQYYQPHEAAVVNALFSKTRNDLFLTTGLDLQTRIYVIGQEEPARVIFFNNSGNPLYWVPYEKHLIFGYGQNKGIDVYDVVVGKVVKADDDGDGKNNSAFESALCEVNPKKANMVIVGIGKGVLELWMVSWTTYAKTGD